MIPPAPAGTDRMQETTCRYHAQDKHKNNQSQRRPPHPRGMVIRFRQPVVELPMDQPPIRTEIVVAQSVGNRDSLFSQLILIEIVRECGEQAIQEQTTHPNLMESINNRRGNLNDEPNPNTNRTEQISGEQEDQNRRLCPKKRNE
jgi:hypothetical protein